ncbi:hypothetical protein CC80DRAFT_124532 [Byssothecium circinans]|uniref:Uncharacterized protein n=1 Tax=Byssothecium circinans TaxID=147558 RepID=A0A6A5TNU4_9PLEO|nr:hypothetical protein CC80DRAFT_124532 [Byssothecium circinans]
MRSKINASKVGIFSAKHSYFPCLIYVTFSAAFIVMVALVRSTHPNRILAFSLRNHVFVRRFNSQLFSFLVYLLTETLTCIQVGNVVCLRRIFFFNCCR